MKHLDSHSDWPIDVQRVFWDRRYAGGFRIDGEAERRGTTILQLVRSLTWEPRPKILEIGCGHGWFAKKLASVGDVTGIDLSEKAIEEATTNVPEVRFFASNIMDLSNVRKYDAVVTLETFAHVPNQKGFVEVVADMLNPRGWLFMTTQNRSVYYRRSDIRNPARGQLRHWVTRGELRRLLSPRFRVVNMFTIQPSGDSGFLGLINSQNLNIVLSRVASPASLQKVKERCGFGQTIVVAAQKI